MLVHPLFICHKGDVFAQVICVEFFKSLCEHTMSYLNLSMGFRIAIQECEGKYNTLQQTIFVHEN